MKTGFNVHHVFFYSMGMVLFFFSKPSFPQKTDTGIFHTNTDVGEVNIHGDARYDSRTGEYQLTGSGHNIWFQDDAFHFLCKRMKGDFILYARGRFTGEGGHPHRKLGWMIRSGLDGNSAHVSAVLHGDGLTAMQYRKEKGDETGEIRSSVTHADVIQLERKGDTFTMRVARFGQPFETMELNGPDIGKEVNVGLFVCSHDAEATETGIFGDVRITIPAPDDLVPYRDFLGSNLEILDVHTGKREIVYTDPGSIQAPNWTPDGRTLIYNRDGLIYTFDLKKRKPKVLNTGKVRQNNNDHVLSFDGKMLGLSSHDAERGGSVVYMVPVKGGTPRLITPVGPSYLHGWSPDGKYLVYTGLRNGEYDIYRIPAEEGEEVRLTTAPGLDDGSEYTPDGKWIYFNSARTGNMKIWRMKPDGSDQEPVTDDAFHDWFPHISPDGNWIVFLSYLKEQAGAEDHPFYKHVYLRMMPVSGGEPRVIAYLYGGQGTINTPSWSPDSKKAAFVSNTLNPLPVARPDRKK